MKKKKLKSQSNLILKQRTQPVEEAPKEEAAKSEDDYDWEEFINSSEDLYGYKARVDHSDDEDDRELPMPARVSMAETSYRPTLLPFS